MDPNSKPVSAQTDVSIAKNKSFFGENLGAYNHNVQQLDTYAAIRNAINPAVAGVDQLLDIGNGGVFDYDTALVRSIVAMDLLFEEYSPAAPVPSNITFKAGSALEIPAENESFDGAIMTMLLHHLVGATVSQCVQNCRRAIGEALRVLRPGGRLVIVESCVPRWFYHFERLVFPLASPLIGWLSSHPATLQYPAAMLTKMIEEHNLRPEVLPIPKGRWVLQYGVKFPSALTPVNVFRFIARKPER